MQLPLSRSLLDFFIGRFKGNTRLSKWSISVRFLSCKRKMTIKSVKQLQISSEPAMAPLSFLLRFDFAGSPRHVFVAASKGGEQIPA